MSSQSTGQRNLSNFSVPTQNEEMEISRTLITYQLDTYLEVLITCVSVFTMILTLVGMVMMNRTKKTPGNVRTLSSWLLALDTLTTMSYSIRRHTDSNLVRMGVQFVGIWATVNALSIVLAMSVDRILIFHWPNFYMRNVTRKCFSIILGIFVAINTMSYLLVRLGCCYLIHSGESFDFRLVFMKQCLYLSGYVMAPVVIFVITFSVAVYLYIAIIIVTHNKRIRDIHTPGCRKQAIAHAHQYRSTLFVFVFVLNVVFTGICYLVISLTLNDLRIVHIIYDLVNLFNNVFDTCIYVFWFKECRMHALKMFVTCCPRLRNRIERMRMEIFNIVVAQNREIDVDESVDPTMRESIF